MKKINKEHLVGIFCTIFAIIVLILSSKLPKGRSEFNIPGPNFFPTLLGIGVLFCGIFQIVYGYVKKDAVPINFKEIFKNLKSRQVINVFITIGLILFFLIFFEIVGFVLCLAIMMAVIMIRFKVPVLKIIISIVIFIAIIIIIFEAIFHITLPLGIIELIL
jgi:putative tricarboxylic transport membrane protein